MRPESVGDASTHWVSTRVTHVWHYISPQLLQEETTNFLKTLPPEWGEHDWRKAFLYSVPWSQDLLAKLEFLTESWLSFLWTLNKDLKGLTGGGWGLCSFTQERQSKKIAWLNISFPVKFKCMDLFFSPASALLPRRTWFHPCWITSSLFVGQLLVGWLID